MDYRLIQLHHAIQSASVLRFIFISGISTGNETGRPSAILGASLDIWGTIISILNCSPRSPLDKALLFVIIEVLIV